MLTQYLTITQMLKIQGFGVNGGGGGGGLYKFNISGMNSTLGKELGVVESYY